MLTGQPTIIRLISGADGAQDSGAGIQVGIALICPLAIITFLRKSSWERPSPYGQSVILTLLILYTISLVVGSFQGAGFLGGLYYVQTVVPLFAWYVAANRGSPPDAHLGQLSRRSVSHYS